jgi:amino acid transporter
MEGSPAVVPIGGATPDPSPAPIKTIGVEPEADKGLKKNALGMLSSVVIGIASTAPAYSLAVTLGFIVAVAGVGLKSPAIMIVSFVPMILIASSYYYLNKVDPDCGTTFSWVTRAIGPRTGWVTGWVMVAADIIVMASLAQITGTYFFLLLGLDSLASSVFWVTVVGVAFLVVMVGITAIGIEVSARLQWFLLGFEYLMLVIFSVVALVKVYASSPAGSVHPSLSWFVPNMNAGALAGGVLLALFIYWGWDTAVSVNEETQNKSIVPGMAAILSTLGLVFIYVLATTAAQAFRGPAYLSNNANDVLSPLGSAVLGSTLSKALVAVVLTSAAASTLTTILPGARTTLSMATHKAIPAVFGRVSPRFQTPIWGTVIYGILSVAWYVGLTLISQNVLADSIAALGLTIAFYYGINGYAVPLFYRHQVFGSLRKFVLLGLFPVLGALALTWVLIASFDYYWYPVNSESGTSWFGVGPPFLLGAFFILSGVVVMLLASRFVKRSRPFFDRKMETVETMVPWDESPDDLLAAAGSSAAVKSPNGSRPGKAA